jgi:hypothetical protein
MQGLWFVRGNLVREVASLNKAKMLPWDSWGLIEGADDELAEADLALLDESARLASNDLSGFDQLRALYEAEARLRVPGSIRSYMPAGPVTVTLN